MLTTVNFNDYSFLITYKVYNVVADRFLSSELQSFNLLRTQVLP